MGHYPNRKHTSVRQFVIEWECLIQLDGTEELLIQSDYITQDKLKPLSFQKDCLQNRQQIVPRFVNLLRNQKAIRQGLACSCK